MSTQGRNVTDELLRDALKSRAGGADGPAALLDDVLLIVQATSQGRGWGLPITPVGRPLVLLVAAALVLSAIVGLALGTGGTFRVTTPRFPFAKPPFTLATPIAPIGNGDIAFVQARYSWNGTTDGYEAPIPTVDDARFVRLGSAGGEPTVLADVPASVGTVLATSGNVGPALQWSPDGLRIAFRLHVDAPGIYVMNRDGSGLARLTDLPEPFGWRAWGLPTRDFAWSADGTRIAFVSPVGTGGPGIDRSGAIYVVDTRDGGLTKLADPNGTGGAFPPIAWSPDGSRIAFARSRGPLRSSTNSVVVMDADGSREVRLVELYDVDLGPLAWSPDGSRIAYMRGSTTDGNEDGGAGLWVAKPDGTDPQRIKAEPFSTEIQAVLDLPLAWSPDGRWITWPGGPANGVLTLVAPNGSGERVIGAPNNGGVEDFAWSPDGSQLVFSDRGGATAEVPPTWDAPSVYVINADGTGQRWLADGVYPDWSR